MSGKARGAGPKTYGKIAAQRKPGGAVSVGCNSGSVLHLSTDSSGAIRFAIAPYGMGRERGEVQRAALREPTGLGGEAVLRLGGHRSGLARRARRRGRRAGRASRGRSRSGRAACRGGCAPPPGSPRSRAAAASRSRPAASRAIRPRLRRKAKAVSPVSKSRAVVSPSSAGGIDQRRGAGHEQRDQRLEAGLAPLRSPRRACAPAAAARSRLSSRVRTVVRKSAISRFCRTSRAMASCCAASASATSLGQQVLAHGERGIEMVAQQVDAGMLVGSRCRSSVPRIRRHGATRRAPAACTAAD